MKGEKRITVMFLVETGGYVDSTAPKVMENTRGTSNQNQMNLNLDIWDISVEMFRRELNISLKL